MEQTRKMGGLHMVNKMKEAIILTVTPHQTLYNPAVLNEKQHLFISTQLILL